MRNVCPDLINFIMSVREPSANDKRYPTILSLQVGIRHSYILRTKLIYNYHQPLG